MYQTSLPTVILTSKFVMTTQEIKAGDSFTIKVSYTSGEEMTVQEVTDISNIWDNTERLDIIDRFKYKEDVTDGFGVISLSASKTEEAIFDEKGEEINKTFEGTITVTAIDDIPASSILKM